MENFCNKNKKTPVVDLNPVGWPSVEMKPSWSTTWSRDGRVKKNCREVDYFKNISGKGVVNQHLTICHGVKHIQRMQPAADLFLAGRLQHGPTVDLSLSGKKKWSKDGCRARTSRMLCKSEKRRMLSTGVTRPPNCS